MRRIENQNQIIQEAIQPFRDLVGPNEWLNFEEFAERIRITESVFQTHVKYALTLLADSDGIIRVKSRNLIPKVVHRGLITKEDQAFIAV